MEQGSEKWLSRLADAGARQYASVLQTPGKGLHSGSFRNCSEQIACRRDFQSVRQAKATLQDIKGASTRR
jgi:hypothetical protein